VPEGNYGAHLIFVFVLSLAITVNALLLQSVYGRERSARGDRLGGLIQGASLGYVNPGGLTLWFGAGVFSLIVAVATAIVLDFGFGRLNSTDPPVLLAVQVSQALLFVLVPAYLVSLLRIYASATQGSLSARTFFEATTDLVLACLVAVAAWLFWAIWGGLAPIPTRIQPIGLIISFAIGCCPSLTLIRRWTASRHVARSLLTVQGLDQSHSTKLYEAGIRNLQNLAHADAGVLFTLTGLQLLWIVDWVAQAQLLVLVSDEFGDAHKLDELRQLGINNILDLAKSLEKPRVKQRVQEALQAIARSPLDKPEKSRDVSDPSLMRSLIEGNPSFRVLRNYADAVEKPPVSVDEVTRAVDQVVHGAPLFNYLGYVVLSLTDLRSSEGARCRAALTFSTKAGSDKGHAAQVQIADGENMADPNGRVPFDVRVNFRPPTIPGRSFKIGAPLKGESSPEYFEVENAGGKSIDFLVKILQSNRLIQTLSATFPQEG
jgi:hypothetical protein